MSLCFFARPSFWAVAATSLFPIVAQAEPLSAQPVDPQEEAPALAISINSYRQQPSSLTVRTTEQARQQMQQIPGAVAVVADEDYKNSAATTLKDVVAYVPGVFAQQKWGDDTRLSIRGSGLSRNYHLRSTQLYLDGIPINTADGYGDFQEIDPTAYRHVDIYKGANAFQLGSNSLGGAINFVTPTGLDADSLAASFDVGSFGFHREQASTGQAFGDADAFATVSRQHSDGERDHSAGDSLRGSANLGYRLSPDAETRFYVNANTVRQDIPGELTKAAALSSPTSGSTSNRVNDAQRNIDTVRMANKTTLRFGDVTADVGVFAIDRHLMHPIYQWLDYQYNDYGAFTGLRYDHPLFGRRNQLNGGLSFTNGQLDNRQYVNTNGRKGTLLSSSMDKSKNYSGSLEDVFSLTPSLSIIAGTKYLNASRDRHDRFLSDGDQSGGTDYDLWSPRLGAQWEVAPSWQVFANVSRSAEVPSFGEGTATTPFTAIQAQEATTYEIGTRGGRDAYHWDVALYRSNIDHELQCLQSSWGNCTVTNADRTVHQGLELGGDARLGQDLMTDRDQLWVKAAYTFNDFKFDGDSNFGDNDLPGAPRHLLHGEVSYHHPSGLTLSPNLEWVPQGYYVDSANTMKTDSYVVFGLRAEQEVNEHLSAYLEGRNLGDTTYISTVSVVDRASASSALFTPGEGRSVFAGLRARW